MQKFSLLVFSVSFVIQRLKSIKKTGVFLLSAITMECKHQLKHFFKIIQIF